jgi:hypothetical protein
MQTEIIIALISAVALIVAGVPAALVERARRENADDHAYVRRILTRVENKLDNHLEDHINGFTRRDKSENKQA